LTGVIDWECLAVHDPVFDLCWWLYAKPSLGTRMLSAYDGIPDPTFPQRARIRFALAPWHEVVHGLTSGEESFIESGLSGVRARLL
jgi:aminoglycoside phosphotransferase (APT) family kinase protein